MRCFCFCFDLLILLWIHLDWALSFVAKKKQCNYICNNREWKSCVLFNPQVFDGKRDRKVLFLTNWISAYGTRTTRQIHSQLFILFFFLEKQQHLNRSLPWTHNLTLKIIQKHHIWHLYFNVFNNYAAIFGEKKWFHSTSDLCHDHTIQKMMLGNFEKENCKISPCATVLKINPMKVKTVSLFYAYILWLNFEFDFLQNGY